eukprot:scaffold2501_cov423-Prasinococcus_capsulatus_cf.AAC.13
MQSACRACGHLRALGRVAWGPKCSCAEAVAGEEPSPSPAPQAPSPLPRPSPSFLTSYSSRTGKAASRSCWRAGGEASAAAAWLLQLQDGAPVPRPGRTTLHRRACKAGAARAFAGAPVPQEAPWGRTVRGRQGEGRAGRALRGEPAWEWQAVGQGWAAGPKRPNRPRAESIPGRTADGPVPATLRAPRHRQRLEARRSRLAGGCEHHHHDVRA